MEKNNKIYTFIQENFIWLIIIGLLFIAFILVVKSANDYQQAVDIYYQHHIKNCICEWKEDDAFKQMQPFNIDINKINLEVNGGNEEWIPK